MPSGSFYTVGTLPPQLSPAQSATFSVGFGPVEVGSADSTLTDPAMIGTNMNNHALQQHGDGSIDSGAPGDAGIEPQPRSSGCGCDARGEPASFVIALVCAFTLRRRRRAVRLS